MPGQCDEAAILERHEPAPRAGEPIQQEAHLQHLVLVELHRPADAEPVALLGNPQLQLVGRDGVDPQLLALRPLDRHRTGIGLQFEQDFEPAFEIIDQHLVRVGTGALAQGRAVGDQRGTLGHFAREVAGRSDMLPADAGQHRPRAQSGHMGRPVGAERPDDQAEPQPVLVRHALHDGCCHAVERGLLEGVDLGADRQLRVLPLHQRDHGQPPER